MSTTGEKTNSRESEVDVIVLGVGTCGEDISLRLLDSGLKVAGIEASLVGGECPYWACLPSKVMIRAASALFEAGKVNEMAGRAQVFPDWKPVASRVRLTTGEWDDSIAVTRYGNRGGRLIHGLGQLTGPRTVTVGSECFTARRGIVIATGSQPSIPPISGLSEVDYWTTHDLIQAGKLPGSLTILGGGPVGCELAQVMARFGVRVSIVQRSDRLLPKSEPEASELVRKAFLDEGINVCTGMSAKQISSRSGEIVVSFNGGEELAAERLLVATGRKVELGSLNLNTAGVDSSTGFIKVDDHMRAAEGIWAIGDVTGKAMFTHVAQYQSSIAAADILGEKHPPARYNAVPRVVFSDPEVGAVGMIESEAKAAGIDAVAVVKQIPYTFRGWIDGETRGMIKLIIDRKTGTLVGATMAGRQAGEVLGLLTLAVHKNLTLDDLRNMIYAFPTLHGAIGEAIGAWGRGVATVFDPEYRDLEKIDHIGSYK
jgi:pyruvate/2-oxoglutarate dehydrogenase complex dihydrolipoamide dehydrogenase (E3) component